MTLSRPSPLSTFAWLIAALMWLAHGQALADPRGARAAAMGDVDVATSLQWHELTPAQRKVLHPLSPHWRAMDETSREKWLNMANRFERLGPAERQRMQERMDQWAKLPPQQRGEARLRFQQTRQIGAPERQRRWAEYQALSPEDRQDLTRQAQRKAKPVFLPNSAVGPREARQAYSAKRRTHADASPQKSNMVPDATPGVASARTVVRPTIVKAGTGATTSLVNQRPSPPMHQQSGLPKIAATQGFVDPVTLLPQKGAQGAAMAEPPRKQRAHQK